MKIFALLMLVFALAASTMALKDAVCGLPHSADGNGLLRCMAYMPSYSYNAETNECIEFVYGGCGGNENRFWAKEECEEKCKE